MVEIRISTLEALFMKIVETRAASPDLRYLWTEKDEDKPPLAVLIEELRAITGRLVQGREWADPNGDVHIKLTFKP